MPSLTTMIEDISPLILYNGNWQAGSSSDSSADLYSTSSFTLTQSDNSSAMFVFNGTGVQIFGARRQNHGTFQINIDGDLHPPTNGTAADPGVFQDLLFNTTSLPQGLHNVTIINNGNTFLDIDFITWQTNIGANDEQLSVNTVQDTDSSFVYEPASAWNTNPKNVGAFMGGSGQARNSSASLQLDANIVGTGDGVALYGPVGPDSSSYSIQLDGGSPRNYDAVKQFYTPQVLLYRADNLGLGQHTLKLLYQPGAPGQVFAIDYANVYVAPSNPRVGSIKSNDSSAARGTIAAIVILVLAILGIAICLLIFIRRRRSRPVPVIEIENVPAKSRISVLATPTLGMAWETFENRSVVDPIVPPAASQIPARPIDSDSGINAGNQRTELRNQNLGRSSSAASSNSYYSSLGQNPFNPGSSSISRANSKSLKPTVPNRSRKGTPSRLPPTAGRSLSKIPETELRTARRMIEGRAQDFGHVSITGIEGRLTLPPDYSQATEPYDRGGRF